MLPTSVFSLRAAGMECLAVFGHACGERIGCECALNSCPIHDDGELSLAE